MSEHLPDVLPTYKGWRAPFFMFTQPFIAWPGLVAALAIATWFGQLLAHSGHVTVRDVLLVLAISPVCGFGVAVLTALPAFFLWRIARTPKPELALEPGETVIFSRWANHWLGHEARGGTLYMTTRALVFVPHRLNVQLAGARVAWSALQSTAWFRIVSATGLPMSAVLVTRTRGDEAWFVVDKSQAIADLADAIAPLDEASRAAKGLEVARANGLSA